MIWLFHILHKNRHPYIIKVQALREGSTSLDFMKSSIVQANKVICIAAFIKTTATNVWNMEFTEGANQNSGIVWSVHVFTSYL